MTVVATAGHVDHGKSSLVLALTGTDPDRLQEEKRRGLTIDLGFAHMTLPSGAPLSFVDVPGHIRFLPNMLAGVGGVSGCVFVVDASEGWKPQSEEHLRILELLDVRHGIVVVTKADLVDSELLELACLDVAEHVEGTFLADTATVAVSAHTGQGLEELRSLLDRLVAGAGAASDRGRPRLWIDRVFAAKGSGTVVTGTLADGSLHVGERIVVEPGHHPARLRAIEHGNRGVDSIGPGQRVALNLASIDVESVRRGDAVVQPDRWLLTDRFDASLDVLSSLDHDVSRRGSYLAYIGSGEHGVSMRVLGADTLAPGGSGAVRIHLPAALALLPGDRFILRESGRDETVGGGRVLDIAPVTKASRAAPDGTIDRLVAERGWLTVDEVELLSGQVVEPTVGHWIAAPGALEVLAGSIRERVAGAGPLGFDVAVLDDRERAVVQWMADVELLDGRLRCVDRSADDDGSDPTAAGDAGDADRRSDPLAGHPFLADLLAGGFAPPPADRVDRSELRELIRRGDVVRRDGVCFHSAVIGDAARIIERLLLDHPAGFTMGQFRTATDTTRKFSVPLAEELDARGVTRRRGDLRIAGPRLATTAHP